MKRLVALMMCAVSLGAAAQSTITYPYNPDGNADGDIAVGDLQDFLTVYGNPFSPSEIMVGDSSLTYWVEQLSQTIQEQQEMIELLQYGNSKNLAFPDGFGGDFIVLNISNEDFTVPQDKNFFITNQYSQNALPRITVDDIPVFEVDGGTLATSQFGSGSTYIVGGGSVLGYTPIVNASPVVNFSGILVDRGVEPIVVDLLQEDFVVPQGYNLHLMSVYSEGFGSGFAQIDGVELFRMGSNPTMWQNLIGGQVIASGNQTVSLVVANGNLELANLSCYLAPIDHFSGPNNSGDSEGGNPVHTADYLFEFDATLQNDTILVQDLVGQDVAYVTAEVVHVDWYTAFDQDVVLSLKSGSISSTRNFGDLELRGFYNGESVIQRTPRNSSSVFTKTIGKLSNSGSAPYFVVSPYSFNGTGGAGQITVRLSYRKS